MSFESARSFVNKNARPLDLARWMYLFEDGSEQNVLEFLAAYQNADGGFGHALEPDCWNPNSSPVQTWTATQIIKEINLEDKEHPSIQGILNYLSSGEDFNGHTWANSIPTNNDYPHAPWWGFYPNPEPTYNPTASLIGYILKFADKDSQLFEFARGLVQEAYAYFASHFPLDAMHTVANFVDLYEYLAESGNDDILDMTEFNKLLQDQIRHVITYDTSRWAVDYVCKPSLFINTKSSAFYQQNEDICAYECEFLAKTQEADGTWAVTWGWGDYPEEWTISKSWWKSELIIKNLKFLKAICG
ncbi:MAG TPA: hypothetical protein PLH64_06785 [Anaerolineaceae bacterium]|nr:hypothetical protein [Anaerolineaceae bacterium]